MPPRAVEREVYTHRGGLPEREERGYYTHQGASQNGKKGVLYPPGCLPGREKGRYIPTRVPPRTGRVGNTHQGASQDGKKRGLIPTRVPPRTGRRRYIPPGCLPGREEGGIYHQGVPLRVGICLPGEYSWWCIPPWWVSLVGYTSLCIYTAP